MAATLLTGSHHSAAWERVLPWCFAVDLTLTDHALSAARLNRTTKHGLDQPGSCDACDKNVQEEKDSSYERTIACKKRRIVACLILYIFCALLDEQEAVRLCAWQISFLRPFHSQSLSYRLLVHSSGIQLVLENHNTYTNTAAKMFVFSSVQCALYGMDWEFSQKFLEE